MPSIINSNYCLKLIFYIDIRELYSRNIKKKFRQYYTNTIELLKDMYHSLSSNLSYLSFFKK